MVPGGIEAAPLDRAFRLYDLVEDERRVQLRQIEKLLLNLDGADLDGAGLDEPSYSSLEQACKNLLSLERYAGRATTRLKTAALRST